MDIYHVWGDLKPGAQFAFYRDFPDPIRHRGEEKF